MTITELAPGELVSAAADFDVVTASLVQSANGAVLDVDALRRTVTGTDTLTVIDITQALGWKLLSSTARSRFRPSTTRRCAP